MDRSYGISRWRRRGNKSTPDLTRAWTKRAALAEICVCLLTAGCGAGKITGTAEQAPGAQPAPGLPGEGSVSGAGGATRRLSVTELGNTIELFTHVRPNALSRIPADARDHGFDRIASSQTVSMVHLEAYQEMAREISTTLMDERRLDDISAACPDTVIPPSVSSVRRHTPAISLAQEPDWAACVGPSSRCPGEPMVEGGMYFLYAEDAHLYSNHEAPASGLYRLTLGVHTIATVSAALYIDGAQADSWQINGGGARELSTELDLDAGRHALEYRFHFADAGGARMEVFALDVEGPVDRNAGEHTDARRACAYALIDTLAAKSYRRPLTEEEQSRLRAIYDTGAQDGFFAEAIHMIFEAIFTSPKFLYLIEIGEPLPGRADVYRLTDHELAARLSYTLCEQPPDSELLAAAASGALATAEGIEAQAARLLDADCGRATVMRFFAQWLELDKLDDMARDPAVYPEFTSRSREAMARETYRYLHELVWNERANLETLLTAPYSWLDRDSAALYGMSLDADQPRRVELPPERAGLFTQPSLLAVTSKFAQTSPVHRGVFVLEKLLCVNLPPPPAGIDITPPPFNPNATTRERWAAHSSSPACAGCHSLIDPVGFSMEGFDAIGRYRTEENGRPVDTRGGIPSIRIADGSISGAADLAHSIAQAPEAAQCFARQWLRFGLGRVERDEDSDRALLADIAQAATGEGNLRSALLTLVTSDSFRYRTRPSAD